MEKVIFGHVNKMYEEEEVGHPKILKYSDKLTSLDLEATLRHQNTQNNQNNNVKMGNGVKRSGIPALVVRNAYKSFKSNQGGTTHVLNDFHMTVDQGSIYSLLGSSGCGKTTLLSCCVGLRDLDKGEIRVYGEEPGKGDCQVPGRNVGYMPQETALYPELTISEVIQYFGRMFGMENKEIEKSTEFLVNFLALPRPSRRISSLSGGQMRRVSFAVALVHSPKLLILDEPTVGVDPLLRHSIWNHLVKLVSSGKTTVIITTHYVEEARQSNQIGLMRNGRLLAENSPEELLKLHNANLLEEIVLKLCLQDNESEDGTSISSESTIEATSSPSSTQKSVAQASPFNNILLHSNLTLTQPSLVCVTSHPKETKVEQKDELICKETPVIIKNTGNINSNSTFPDEGKGRKRSGEMVQSLERISAMTLKNAVTLLRNIPFLIFIFFVPALQVIIVCIAIGPDPKGLPFGLVNLDVVDARECIPTRGCITSDTFNASISCRFLEILQSHGTLHLKIFESEEMAAEDVKNSKSWGYLAFSQNFTESMKSRALFGIHAEPQVYYGSRIKFKLDQSNLQIYRETAKVFLESFSEFMEDLSADCNADPIYAQLPIYFADPIFGKPSISFTDFLAPSILLAVLMFFPLCGSGMAYITERKTGTLARSIVAGVKTFEIMGAYLIVQLVLLIIQTGLAFLILNIVFQIEMAGSITWALTLSILVGVCGMSLGFLIAAVCIEESQAILFALATFIPNMLLSGLLWPIQGMPIYLQYFSYALPCTLAAEALRSILARGVGITHPAVWPGFVSILSWIILYWTLNIAIHRFKSKK